MMSLQIRQSPVVAAIILEELAARSVGCQCEGHNGHKHDGEDLSKGVHVGYVESKSLILVWFDWFTLWNWTQERPT